LGAFVSERLVAVLMRHVGNCGLPGPIRVKRMRGKVTVGDLVNRRFRRDRPNELYCRDIMEHLTREGKVYCCRVPEKYPRSTIGWSIESVQNSNLVLNVLDTAIKHRRPAPIGVVHSDSAVHVVGLNQPHSKHWPDAIVRSVRQWTRQRDAGVILVEHAD
jgi:transposase InsO family protein